MSLRSAHKNLPAPFCVYAYNNSGTVEQIFIKFDNFTKTCLAVSIFIMWNSCNSYLPWIRTRVSACLRFRSRVLREQWNSRYVLCSPVARIVRKHEMFEAPDFLKEGTRRDAFISSLVRLVLIVSKRAKFLSSYPSVRLHCISTASTGRIFV